MFQEVDASMNLPDSSPNAIDVSQSSISKALELLNAHSASTARDRTSKAISSLLLLAVGHGRHG